MAQIIEILGALATRLGIPVLTPEYEITLTLLEQADLTADQLIERSSLSRAGFFNTIDRLKMWGIVACRTSPTDRRCKLYRLEDDLRDLIIARFGQYKSSHLSVGDLGIHRSDLKTTSEKVKLGNKLDHLTCEFQILLYLYLLPGTTHTDLKTLVDSSGTKLNSSLKYLTDKGMVYFTRHGEDKRRKLYYASSPVSKILDISHQEVFDWLDATLNPRQGSLRAKCG